MVSWWPGKRNYRCIVLFCLCLCVTAGVCRAQTHAGRSKQLVPIEPQGAPCARLALLIGNQGYKGEMRLDYPANDVKLMGKLLEEAGFQVTSVTDVDEATMTHAIDAFTEKVKSSNAKVALFFFSGHGVQVGEKNYLVPLFDQIPDSEEMVRRTTTSADRVLEGLDSARCALKIMILDACRNNPFKSLQGSKATEESGLANMSLVNGTVIVYATAPRKQAEDGIFTPIFVEQIRKTKGQTFGEVMDATYAAVKAKTNGRQQPWCHYNTGGGFRFFPTSGQVDGGNPHQPENGEPKQIPEITMNSMDGIRMGKISTAEEVASLYLYLTPVTVGQYERYCAENHKSMPDSNASNPNWLNKSAPMAGVSWSEAMDYCKWAGGTLPTAEQLEAATQHFEMGSSFDFPPNFGEWTSKTGYRTATVATWSLEGNSLRLTSTPHNRAEHDKSIGFRCMLQKTE